MTLFEHRALQICVSSGVLYYIQDWQFDSCSRWRKRKGLELHLTLRLFELCVIFWNMNVNTLQNHSPCAMSQATIQTTVGFDGLFDYKKILSKSNKYQFKRTKSQRHNYLFMGIISRKDFSLHVLWIFINPIVRVFSVVSEIARWSLVISRWSWI